MKNKLFKGIFFTTFLLAFVVGCGKDGGGGGGSSSNPYTGNVPATSQQALANFRAWYNSTTESAYPGIGSRTEKRVLQTFSSTDGCESKPISIFGVSLGNINYCFGSSNPVNLQNLTRTVYVLASQTKSQNAKLVAANSGSGMTLANVSQTNGQYGGAVYYIEYAKSNGHRVVYVIDTGLNSAFNPVKITDSEARTVEEVTNIY